MCDLLFFLLALPEIGGIFAFSLTSLDPHETVMVIGIDVCLTLCAFLVKCQSGVKGGSSRQLNHSLSWTHDQETRAALDVDAPEMFSLTVEADLLIDDTGGVKCVEGLGKQEAVT